MYVQIQCKTIKRRLRSFKSKKEIFSFSKRSDGDVKKNYLQGEVIKYKFPVEERER